MFELSLLCPEDRVEVLSDALDALEGLPLSVLDDYLSDAGTERHGPDSLRIMRRR